MVDGLNRCNAEDLVSAVGEFARKRILVVGDMMLDRFIWGAVNRISPEAPVPVVDVKTESTHLGGGANVSANIRSLGAKSIPLGVIGDDFEGRRLKDELRSMELPLRGLVVDRERYTTVKTRIIAHHQQVCRTDREDRQPLSESIQQKVLERFRAALPRVDAVVISDYAKGLLTKNLLRSMLPIARRSGVIVCIDPRSNGFAPYGPATIMTPNAHEAERATGISISNRRDLLRAGRTLLAKTRIQNLLITRGEEGMTLFKGKDRAIHIPTVAREVFDVTGAGDTVISTLALGLTAGLPVLEAAVLSNVAAGIVVAKLGTASIRSEELLARISGR